MKEDLLETLQAGPGEAARQEVAVGERSPVPSRWTLRTIRASVAWLTEYTLSGVWRVLQTWGLGLHAACSLVQSRPDLSSQGAALASLFARRRAPPGLGGGAVSGRVWLSALA